MTKDQQDALIFISKTNRSLHSNRIKRDYQIVFRILTFFALCVAARFAPNHNFPKNCTFNCIVWISFLALASITVYDYYTSGKANEFNQSTAHKAENIIIEELKIDLNFIKPDPIQPRKNIWIVLSTISLLSAIAAAYTITSL